jgi:hypothetical protein
MDPELTELVEVAPDGREWLREIKVDGYRMHALLERGATGTSTCQFCQLPSGREGVLSRSPPL